MLHTNSEIRDGQVVVLDGVLDKGQLAAARNDVGRLHDGGRCVLCEGLGFGSG